MTRRKHLCLFPGMLILLTGIQVSSPAFASQEHIAPWTSVTLTAKPLEPFGAVNVVAETDPSSGKIKTLRVFHGNKELTIPAEALEVLHHPALDTLRITCERGYDTHPWLYVSVVLDPRDGKNDWLYPRVYFAFQNDRFVKRFVTTKKSDGTVVDREEWKPSTNREKEP